MRDRDIASVVNEARAAIDAQVKLPAGYWLYWGGQFENLATARNRIGRGRPGLLCADFPLADERAWFGARCASGV